MDIKRLFKIVTCALLICSPAIKAQDVVTDSKAEALEQQAKAKQEKGDKKANKKKSKAEKKADKATKKAQKREAAEKAYYEFLANYQPIEANTGYEAVDAFITRCNGLFETLVGVEQSVGYIEVVTHREYDDFMEDTITVVDAVRSKISGEEVDRGDAAKAYTAASLQLTTATAELTTLTLEAANVVTSSISNPMQAIPVVAKIKPISKQLKVTGQVLPVIAKRIQENRDALNFKRNNLASEAETEDTAAE